MQQNVAKNAGKSTYHVVCIDRCNSTQFHCSRGNSCINAEQECDGFTNCNDTSDEANCCEFSLNNRSFLILQYALYLSDTKRVVLVIIIFHHALQQIRGKLFKVFTLIKANFIKMSINKLKCFSLHLNLITITHSNRNSILHTIQEYVL